MNQLLFCCFLLFFNLLNLTAQSELADFKTANDAFKNKDFETAIQGYQNLIEEGFASAELHYNLGNAYFRKGDLGPAIWHYEKAAKLSPSDGDIQHNLRVANSLKKDEIVDLPQFFLTRWWNNISGLLGSGAWAILGLLFLLASAGSFSLWILGDARELRKKGFVIGIILLILTLLPFAFAWNQLDKESNSYFAVILEKKTTLRSAPDGDSAEVMKLHEGTKVELLDKLDNWHKVRLGDGEQGWLKKETLGMI